MKGEAVTFQELILALQDFWAGRGCLIVQPHDIETGAGTFNPHTFLRVLGPEPWNCAYVEPSRRPTDSRYGENPNRLQRYYQFQVVLKPSPLDIQDVFLQSLAALGLSPGRHDIRFVEDDWESPTLGAWGLGWEVWVDGMEITQFTYFQQVGGFDLRPVSVELTYGIERIALFLQNVDSIYDLKWNRDLTYGEVHHQDEVDWSRYNLEDADVEMQLSLFNAYEAEARRLADDGLAAVAYDYCLKCSHAFNMLDARGAISVTERQNYIVRVRNLARLCAEGHVLQRSGMGYPLLDKLPEEKRGPLVNAWTQVVEQIQKRRGHLGRD